MGTGIGALAARLVNGVLSISPPVARNVGELLITSNRDPNDPAAPYPVPWTRALTEYGHDDPAVTDYEIALDATGMRHTDSLSKRNRFFALHRQVARVVEEGLAGDIVECGVFNGHSAYMIALHLQRLGFPGAMHVFDSFEGLSELTPQDRSGVERSAQEEARVRNYFAATESVVRGRLAPFPFIAFYKGWIPERFPEVADRTFALVHMDVDLYEPTMQAITFFWPRLVSRGAMLFDDHGIANFPGARAAVEEALGKRKDAIVVPTYTGGSVVLKV